MHEVGIAQQMLDVALNYAAKNNAERITTLFIEMSAAEESDESLRFHIERLAQETIARGARVEITRLPIPAKCLNCGCNFGVMDPTSACPSCNSMSVNVLPQDEFKLTSIEVE